MKIKILPVFVAMLIAIIFSMPSTTKAQSYHNNLAIDPLDLLISKALTVTYEKQLSPKNSMTIFGQYINWSEWWKGYSIGGSYRWYLKLGDDNVKPIQGLSVGPMAVISYWSTTYYTSSANLSIGGEAAYKWVFDGFSVEPIVRLGFVISNVSNLGYSPMGGGVNLGYAW